jgi:hypothetical protein
VISEKFKSLTTKQLVLGLGGSPPQTTDDKDKETRREDRKIVCGNDEAMR